VVLCAPVLHGQGADLAKVIDDITSMNQTIKDFSALVTIIDKRGDEELVASSTLSVSKQYGWKIEDRSSDREHVIINDFETSYEFFPRDKKVIKYRAETPEMVAEFRKPAREINPLTVLDRKTLKLVGTEEFEGEMVYHFEGTTTTQFLAKGKPVTRKISAWISATDGLPRKTIESVGESVGTTKYSKVRVNLGLEAKTFQFSPPDDVEVVDVNAEMKKQAGKRDTKKESEP
jgi:outer membrane lipoprotein-sorting protein